MITCDETIETTTTNPTKTVPTKSTSTKTVPTESIPTNFNEKKVTCKTKKIYFTCVFINYHTIIVLLQYFLLLHKVSSKTKHLLPHHSTNFKLKEIGIENIS